MCVALEGISTFVDVVLVESDGFPERCISETWFARE